MLGSMEGFKAIPYIFLVLAVSAIVGGASAVVLAEFADTTTDTAALAVIANGTDAIGTIAGQLSTVGIIGIMVIIIGLLAGVFVYFQYFQ